MWVLCCFNLGCETILSKWPNNDVWNTWKKRRNHGRNKEKFNRLRRWCSTEETCIFIIFVEMRWVAWISSKMILSKYLQILGINHNAHIYLWTQTASNDRFTTERDAKRKCQFQKLYISTILCDSSFKITLTVIHTGFGCMFIACKPHIKIPFGCCDFVGAKTIKIEVNRKNKQEKSMLSYLLQYLVSLITFFVCIRQPAQFQLNF